MAETDAAFRERVSKIVREIRVAQAKSYELMEQLEAVLASNPTVNEQVRQLLDAWAKLWPTKYPGERYPFEGAPETLALKRLLKTLERDEIITRMHVYLNSRDTFHVKVRHGFHVFAKQINEFGKRTPAHRQIASLDQCHHTPKCGDLYAHDRLERAEASGDAQLVDSVRRLNGKKSAMPF